MNSLAKELAEKIAENINEYGASDDIVDAVPQSLVDGWAALIDSALPKWVEVTPEFVEEVEQELGMGSGAWDMVKAEDICNAVLKISKGANMDKQTKEIIEAAQNVLDEFDNDELEGTVATSYMEALRKKLKAMPLPAAPSTDSEEK